MAALSRRNDVRASGFRLRALAEARAKRDPGRSCQSPKPGSLARVPRKCEINPYGADHRGRGCRGRGRRRHRLLDRAAARAVGGRRAGPRSRRAWRRSVWGGRGHPRCSDAHTVRSSMDCSARSISPLSRQLFTSRAVGVRSSLRSTFWSSPSARQKAPPPESSSCPMSSWEEGNMGFPGVHAA